MTAWSTAVKFGPVALVLIAGIASLALFPAKAYENVSQELIALFGLMMAGVLPTMVLTASVLRAGNLSVKKLLKYQEALRRQLAIWIGLFLISLFASFLVVLGKMIGWTAELNLALFGLTASAFELGRLLNAAITMAIVLIVFRAGAVGAGILSLLRLSGEIALSEAQARDEVRAKAAEAAVDAIPERENFGAYVELKH